MTTVSSIVLKYSAQGAERVQRADDNVRKGVTKTGQVARKETGTIHRWLAANKSALMGIGGALGGILAGVIAASPLLSAQMGGIRLAFSLLADSIGDRLMPFFILMEDGIYNLVDAFNALPSPIQDVIAYTIGIAGAIGTVLFAVGLVGPNIVAGFKLMGTFFAWVGGLISSASSAVATWAAAAVEFVAGSAIITGALAVIAGAIIGFGVVWLLEVTGVMDKIAEFSQWIGGALGAAAAPVQAAASIILAPLLAIGAGIMAIVEGKGWDGFVTNLQSAFGPAGQFFQALWNGIASGAAAAWNGIVGVFQSAWSGISGFFTGIIPNAFGWGSDLLGHFADGITSMIGAVGNAAKGAWDSFTSWLGFDLPENDAMAKRFGSDLGGFFADGLRSSIGDVEKAAKASINVVTDWIGFDNPDNDAMARRFGKDAAHHFGAGLESGFESQQGSNLAGDGITPTPAPVGAAGQGISAFTLNIEAGAFKLESTGSAAIDEDRLVDKIVQRVGERNSARTTR